MSTDKITLEITTEKINETYTPIYVPIFTLLTNQKKYEEKVGQVKLEEANLIGDAKARKITEQDTEIKHAQSAKEKKNFVKYFFGIKYKQSGFQDNTDFTKIANIILDENMMHFDKIVFQGDLDKGGVPINDALWNSTDKDYITKPSSTISSTTSLNDIKEIFDELIQESEENVGNIPKQFILVGKFANNLGKYINNTATTYLQAIRDAYNATGKQISFEVAPQNIIKDLDTNNSNGVLLFAPQKVTFHYTKLPSIDDQGYNAENKYTWMNLFFGSSKVSIDKLGAMIKKPLILT
ncbi:MAG: hypothetical protein LBF97_07840 [Elusimicrobiota bacterium]|jgi:hypothetical protein|nr:hypothetical protein [Elusimicrobiota bacterium]